MNLKKWFKLLLLIWDGKGDKVLASRLKLHNKKQNINFKQYFKNTFFSFKLVIGAILLSISVYSFQENKLALKTLFSIIIVAYIACMFRFALKYKVMNSARLSSILVFITLPISIFNLIIYFPKVFFDYEVGISVISLTVIIVSYFSAIGISFLNKEFKKKQIIYNQLTS